LLLILRISTHDVPSLSHPARSRRLWSLFGPLSATVYLAALLAGGWTLAQSANSAPATQRISTERLAAMLKSGTRPSIVCVGFRVLYEGAHIPGAIYGGPAARPEGLDDLRRAVNGMPRNRQLVIYCGCCPWDRCPNIGPAFALLRRMGFQHLQALYLPNSFAADWVGKGLPWEGSNRSAATQ
jgi:thiosulfate/3-mercaptopyruvate sulfurtransferase